jgi:hypothetical protein
MDCFVLPNRFPLKYMFHFIMHCVAVYATTSSSFYCEMCSLLTYTTISVGVWVGKIRRYINRKLDPYTLRSFSSHIQLASLSTKIMEEEQKVSY